MVPKPLLFEPSSKNTEPGVYVDNSIGLSTAQQLVNHPLSVSHWHTEK